jgi:hypothetical protein
VLAHASAAITLRTYAHLWPGDEDRTREVMDSVLAEAAQASVNTFSEGLAEASADSVRTDEQAM